MSDRPPQRLVPAQVGIPASTGNVLSIAHAAGLQSSFPLLAKRNKFSKVLFFGRITGKAGDYLIAMGLEDSWLAGKKFFWWCVFACRFP